MEELKKIMNDKEIHESLRIFCALVDHEKRNLNSLPVNEYHNLEYKMSVLLNKMSNEQLIREVKVLEKKYPGNYNQNEKYLHSLIVKNRENILGE